MQTKWKYWLKNLSVICFILSLTITLTINCFPLYHWELAHTDILTEVGLSKQVMLKNYWQLMAYLNFPWKSTLTLSNFPVSASGAQHFFEVKRLFLLCYAILIISVVPAIIHLVSLYRTKTLWLLDKPFKLLALLPFLLGFGMLLGFDRFFTLFHEVLFANDAWLFDPATDPIILALPETFFQHCFVLAFLLLECFALIGIWLGRRQLKQQTS